MSRQYTTDEVREKLLRHLAVIADYWDTVVGPKDQRERIHGAVFSVLSTLDGSSIDVPGFIVAPRPHEDDKQYHIDNGNNWFPENHQLDDQIQSDIGGCLHELFHKYEVVKRKK